MSCADIDTQSAASSPRGASAIFNRHNGALRYVPVMLLALIGGLASIGAFLTVAHWDANIARLSFEDRAKSHEQALNEHLSNAAGVLFTLKAFFESTAHAIGAAEYEAFSASLRKRFVGLRDTGWSPRVTRNEREAFEQNMRATGFAHFQITERNAEGKLIRAQDRDEYYPILYSDPLAPNLVVLGFDVGSEKLRRQAINTALASGLPAATPPLTLVNQSRQQQGFIGFLPVYSSSRLDDHNVTAVQGVVFDVFETGQMIGDVLASRMHMTGVNIYFFDPYRPFGDRLIYWHSSHPSAVPEPAPSEATVLAGPHWIGSLDMDDQHWGAIFVPDEPLGGGFWTWNAVVTLGAGITMTTMIVTYLLFSIRHAIGLENLTARLRQTTDELRREGDKVNHLAHHDTLTGLPNRLSFRSEAERALRRTRRGESFALLYLDLDRFKDVNDTLGHPIGDALLREVATRLQAEVREVDTVARLGGDEFAVVQTDVKQPNAAQVLAARCIETLSEPYMIDDHRIVVGVSIGVALAGGNAGANDVDTLMRNADLAMYRAKEDGRGGLRFFDPGMDAQAQARRKLEIDLRRALEQGQFELYYQPLVSILERRISGFEALLRWHHPTRGLVLPLEFIPLAEEIGLIVPIGEWVLREGCAEAARWGRGDLKGEAPRVAINVSAVQFGDPDLVATVANALAVSGLPAERLELEITESVLLHDAERTLVMLHELRALGVRISMDDFGTGYSSLSYLRSFPFDKIKIDQSFVRNLADSDESSAIVRAVAALGASLRIITLAEGVETSAQLEQLIASGCTEVQGYFFSPPLPSHQVAGLLVESERTWPVAA